MILALWAFVGGMLALSLGATLLEWLDRRRLARLTKLFQRFHRCIPAIEAARARQAARRGVR